VWNLHSILLLIPFPREITLLGMQAIVPSCLAGHVRHPLQVFAWCAELAEPSSHKTSAPSLALSLSLSNTSRGFCASFGRRLEDLRTLTGYGSVPNATGVLLSPFCVSFPNPRHNARPTCKSYLAQNSLNRGKIKKRDGIRCRIYYFNPIRAWKHGLLTSFSSSELFASRHTQTNQFKTYWK
jgi:hypothetical protein